MIIIRIRIKIRRNKYLNTIIYLINYYGKVRKKNNMFKHDC
jgi:hypothetical protein